MTSLGFKFTKAEESRMRQAVRESLVFMQTFGKGTRPRTRGTYYAPGASPIDDARWLGEEMARRYVGCSTLVFSNAIRRSEIVRRKVVTRRGATVWVYHLGSLDDFINRHGLR